MPVMVLAVPLYNMIYVIIFRFRNDLPIANHDLNHLHHRLMRLGLSPKGSVWVIYLFTFSLSINSILLIQAQWWEALIIFIQVCATVILFFVMELSRQEKEIPSTSSVQSSES
jgi:UDP-GlcNAc:undecaprenyl-phosphate GlcNAc-1-phosphate transferase